METFSEVTEKLHRYFLRRLPALAEDLVQETILRTIQTAGPNADLPWVFGIARQCCREAKRAQRRASRRRAPPRIPPAGLPDFSFLDRRDRGLLQLKYVEGWKCREIASAFGVSVGHVTMSLSRIYQRVRNFFQYSTASAIGTKTTVFPSSTKLQPPSTGSSR